MGGNTLLEIGLDGQHTVNEHQFQNDFYTQIEGICAIENGTSEFAIAGQSKVGRCVAVWKLNNDDKKA